MTFLLRLYMLRKNSILPSVLKGHGFSRADKVNQISVGFSHRGTYFRIFGEIQPFSAARLAAEGWFGGIKTFPQGLQRNQGRCISKPMSASRREHQEAATWHRPCRDTVTLVSL